MKPTFETPPLLYAPLVFAVLAGGTFLYSFFVVRPLNIGKENLSSSCQSNLKQIALAIRQYAKDYDDKFPPVSVSNRPSKIPPYTVPYGWADAFQPYFKNISDYQCPSEVTTPTADSTSSLFIDYWFNANLSCRSLSEISSRQNTFLMGEGLPGNARAARTTPMSQTTGTPTDKGIQTAWRHFGGANFSFADGHVKWLKPGEVTTKPGDPFTFSIR